MFFFFFIFSAGIFSKTEYIALCKKNEKVIFTFSTKDKKIMSVCADEDESYIIYRYGTKNKTDMEFPGDKTGSWSQFKYSYYLRGGGADNEGIDINYLRFDFNGFYYSVYEEFSAADNKRECGIKIINKTTAKETTIAGIPDSIGGSLAVLREYSNIQIEE